MLLIPINNNIPKKFYLEQPINTLRKTKVIRTSRVNGSNEKGSSEEATCAGLLPHRQTNQEPLYKRFLSK